MPNGPENPQRTISDQVAHLHKHRLGRGPRRVTTTILGDTVSIVLEGARTPHEELLLEAGATDLVLQVRERTHRHLAPAVTEIVALASGRDASGQVIGYDPQLGVATMTVVLHPDPTRRGDTDG